MNVTFKQQIITLGRQGQAVCNQLERGQAETPLAEHFCRIEHDIDSAPFSVIILGLTTSARTEALGWLYGNEFSLLSVNIVKQLGLVEISLRERGYTLERANGERQEFDRLDPFMEALQQSDVLSPLDGNEWFDPVKLEVNSPKGLQGLTVYMPESPQMILDNPSLLNRVVSQANLLIVAAPLHHELSDAEQKSILEVSQNMDGFWPLLVVDELEDDMAMPSIGWWQKHNTPTVQIKPQLLTTHIAANIPNMLLDVNDSTRQALFLHLQTRRIANAAEAVTSRCEQEQRQLQSRKTREQRRAKSGEAGVKEGAAARHQWDTIKTSFTDALTRVDKQLQTRGKKAMLPEGPLISELTPFLDKLRVEDLDQETGHKTVKLTIKEAFLSDLKNHIKNQFKHNFKGDTEHLAKQLTEQQQNLEASVKQLSGLPASLVIEPLDQRSVWSELKAQLSVSVRYRGEMPKRGFLARLSDGRRAIMGISMMAMVVGGVFKAVWGVDFRAVIMLVAPLIFFGAIIYSYVVWPKEDAERLAKELEKVRDGLSTELKRILNELQREKQLKISDHLDSQKKQLNQKLDNIMRESQARHENALAEQREQAQKRLQQIDQQLKDLQLIERDVSALNRDCDNLVRDGLRTLQNIN